MRFTRYVCVLLLLVIAAFAAYGQTSELPADLAGLRNNFGGFGFGFQKAGTPQASGWAEICHRNPDVDLWGMRLPSFACASTDYVQGATSARVDAKTVIFHRKVFYAGTLTGAGAAIGTNGVGASYALGGWGGVDLSRFLRLDGVLFVGSVAWQKDDISVAAAHDAAPAVLKTLSERAVVRLGFGKSW